MHNNTQNNPLEHNSYRHNYLNNYRPIDIIMDKKNMCMPRELDGFSGSVCLKNSTKDCEWRACDLSVALITETIPL